MLGHMAWRESLRYRGQGERHGLDEALAIYLIVAPADSMPANPLKSFKK